ncbi:MAG: acetolactate synthase large subunit [Acidimicrobiaceae bacterium]|nr:acetolactate synthase large subunit [Acidimicrobiaceae bacterium]
MNGANALLRALLEAGVDVCFSNPGTSEMHFVSALDQNPEMRGVLCLYEGVASGAADGYARVSGKASSVLLHLGPGLSNASANLHNARRAGSPVVNIIGDHASYHLPLDPPLASDIEALAGAVSKRTIRITSQELIAAQTRSAVESAMNGRRGVVSLIVPADFSWLEVSREVGGPVTTNDESPEVAELGELARRISSADSAVLLLGASAQSERGAKAAKRIADTFGVRVFSETFTSIAERGAGIASFDKLSYFSEAAIEQLKGADLLVLCGAEVPVAFFAYPGLENRLVPPGTEIVSFTTDRLGADLMLEELCQLLGIGAQRVEIPVETLPEMPKGQLTGAKAAMVIANVLPRDSIVSEEAITNGASSYLATRGSRRHRWMNLMGGAIGQGMPLATGAAIASPDSKVVNLQADGSALYTIQSLWTQAREGLDVTTVIFNNQSYAILQLELGRVRAAGEGEESRKMLELFPPNLDFVSISEGFGVSASRAQTAEELELQLARAFEESGPHLIEAILPTGLS